MSKRLNFPSSFSLQVTSEGRTLLVLCGRNSGQHLYLEVERQGQEFELRAGLKDKFVLGEEARFNIKVTQVDCRSGEEDQSSQAISFVVDSKEQEV